MYVKGGSFLTLKLHTQIRYKYPRDKVLKVRKKVLAKAVLTVFFFSSCYSEVCLEQTCLLRRKASTGYEGKAAEEFMELKFD